MGFERLRNLIRHGGKLIFIYSLKPKTCRRFSYQSHTVTIFVSNGITSLLYRQVLPISCLITKREKQIKI